MSTTCSRPHHVELHQVDQRGAAGEKLDRGLRRGLLPRRAAERRARGGGRSRGSIDEGSHGSSPSAIASRRGLLDGRDDVGIGGAAAEIAAHVFADVGVAAGMAFVTQATAEMICPGVQ